MPLALKPLCLIQFWNWKISLFSLIALWGKKNWPPRMKVQQIGNCQNKMGLKGCKWSSLNAPGTQTPLSHSVLEMDFSLFSLAALWGNRNWPPSMKVRQIENELNKIGLNWCKRSSLNAPGTENPLSHSLLKLGDFPFLTISPLG